MNERRRQQHGDGGDAAPQIAGQGGSPAPEPISEKTGPEACVRRERRSEHSLLSKHEECAPPPCPTRGEKRSPKKLNLVFEAAGSLGTAEVGAFAALSNALVEDEKYRETYISYLAGTSYGAVIAALVGAGYTHAEITDQLNFEATELARLPALVRLPVVGPYAAAVLGLATGRGWLNNNRLRDRLRGLLRAKRVKTFGDLIMPGCERERDPARRYRVHVIASDITRGRMLVLPDDANTELYGVEPDDLNVEDAVMMSLSMPFMLPPVVRTGANGVKSFLVDGVLTSGFPIHLFDVGAPDTGDTLTFGIRVQSDHHHEVKRPFLYHMAKAMFFTAFSARDVSETQRRVDKLKWARALQINTGNISPYLPTSPLTRDFLYNAGYFTMKRAIDGGILRREAPIQEVAERAEQAAAGLSEP